MTKKLNLKLKIRKVLGLGLLLLFMATIPSSAKQLTLWGRYKIKYSGHITTSAYNSLASQTDSTPWITASGTRCREGVIASNYLPIGTRVMFDKYPNRVFVVEDRMNARYYKRIDIWFRDYQDALDFGVRNMKYHVLARV